MGGNVSTEYIVSIIKVTCILKNVVRYSKVLVPTHQTAKCQNP